MDQRTSIRTSRTVQGAAPLAPIGRRGIATNRELLLPYSYPPFHRNLQLRGWTSGLPSGLQEPFKALPHLLRSDGGALRPIESCCCHILTLLSIVIFSCGDGPADFHQDFKNRSRRCPTCSDRTAGHCDQSRAAAAIFLPSFPS